MPEMSKDRSLNDNLLSVAVCQFGIQPGAVEKNIGNGLKAVKDACSQNPDIVVMPELWSSGYSENLLHSNAKKTPEILKAAGKLAWEHNTVIAGTLPELSEGRLYNTLFVTGTQGKTIASYRKIHLFPLLEEDKWFAPGNQTIVFKCRDAILGCMTCYDLRFSEMGLSLAANGAQVLIVPAQWPAARIDHWDILLSARAIENQVFVAAANRCDTGPDPEFCGHSRIISPDGTVMADAGHIPGSVHSVIDLSEINKMRSRFCPVRERRPDVYGKI
jgi:predicted amidohydrolase